MSRFGMGRCGSGLRCLGVTGFDLVPAETPANQPDAIEARLVAFGKRLRELREIEGLSQEKLAERSGLHWSFIGRVERGQRNPNLKNVFRLAHGLGVEPYQLLVEKPGVKAP